MEPALFRRNVVLRAVYELDPEVGKRLLRGEEVEITERDLTLRQDGNENPWREVMHHTVIRLSALWI